MIDNNIKVPSYWFFLSEEDQQMYIKMSKALAEPTLKNKRNTKFSDFENILEAINIYINHEQFDKWKRCLATGVFIFEDGIAVNNKRLKVLVHRCKTSINTSLKGLGYTIIKCTSAECQELLTAIPFLANNQHELRQWTIRYKQKKNSSTKDRKKKVKIKEEMITPTVETLENENEQKNDEKGNESTNENPFEDMFSFDDSTFY